MVGKIIILIYSFPLTRRVIGFIINILPLPGWALLSFVLRKRVTRESNLRGVIATRSSPLKNPLLFFGARTMRTAPRERFLNNVTCGTVRARARAAITKGVFRGIIERSEISP